MEIAIPLDALVGSGNTATDPAEAPNYGHTFEVGYLFNVWTGGNPSLTLQGNYQLCLDSALAYRDVLAPMVGATLSKFARVPRTRTA